MELGNSNVVRNIPIKVNHYWNSTRVDSWLFNKFKDTLYDRVETDTEEELIFKRLLYIYEDFIKYSFALDVSEVFKLLTKSLSNNPKLRSYIKRLELVNDHVEGILVNDKVEIDLILEDLEYIIEHVLKYMTTPDRSFDNTYDRIYNKYGPKVSRIVKWKKLPRTVNIINPISEQLELISDNI